MRKEAVAFLGTSPGMSFVIERVGSHRPSVVFSSGNIGGAWAESELGGVSAPRAVNYINSCVESSEPLDLAADFESALVDRGAILKLLPSPEIGNQNRLLVGRILPVVSRAIKLDSVTLVRGVVRRVEIFPDHVVIDGERFSSLYLPENFWVPEFYISGVRHTYQPASKTFVHYRAKFRNSVDASNLEKDWDSRFDRGGMQYPSKHVFVGRVRREWEENPDPLELMRDSEWLNSLASNIEAFDLPSYTSHKLLDDDLSRLRKDLEGFAAVVVPTRSLLDSYVFSKKKL